MYVWSVCVGYTFSLNITDNFMNILTLQIIEGLK